MPISDVRKDGNWIVVYDDRGKEIRRTGGYKMDVVGITGSFFVVDEGGVWIVTYDEQCKSIARMGGRNKTVRGASGNTFTVEDGPWFVTYDRRCKELARRGRGGSASAKRAKDLGSIQDSARTIVETGKSVAEIPAKGCGLLIALISAAFFAIKGCLFTSDHSNLSTPQQSVSSGNVGTTVSAYASAPEIQRAVPVAEPTPPLTPFYQSSTGQTFSVVGIAAGDTLNVRNGPSAANGVTIQLPNGYGGITLIGSPVMNDSTEWVNVRFRGGSGWVNRQYLRANSE